MVKKTEEEIDEDFIIASMNMTGPTGLNKIRPAGNASSLGDDEAEKADTGSEQIGANAVSTEEKEVRRKKGRADYESLFIRPAVWTGRQEKTTYLREEFYNRIMKVILLYGNPRLSVFAYVDAVLEHHFEVYRQDIMAIYNKKNSAPY